MDNREVFMKLALELAARGRGQTSPNPIVGALVVSKGQIVGEGYHRKAGEPHAEIHALREAGERARGADLYVTLEPCAHQGRTPPCTEAIVAAGIRRVLVAVVDPNPLVNGKGLEALAGAGIQVATGVLEHEARRLNEAYFKHVTRALPFVTLKMALSLDGKIATRTGDSRWISGEEARNMVHRWRAAADAIMVGVGTILADDPLLTVRLPGWEGRQPKRIIVDSSLRTPPTCRILRETREHGVIVATTDAASETHAEALIRAGAETLRVPGHGARVDLLSLLRILGSWDITSVMVEGGASLFTSVIEAGLVDKVAAFISPVLIGGAKAPSPFQGKGVATMSDAIRLMDVTVNQVGPDVLVEGYVVRGRLAGTQAED